MHLCWYSCAIKICIRQNLNSQVHLSCLYAVVNCWTVKHTCGLSTAGHADSHRCYDTSKFHKPLAGWTGQQMPMRNLLRFIGKQADAIHDVDPKVTIGKHNSICSTIRGLLHTQSKFTSNNDSLIHGRWSHTTSKNTASYLLTSALVFCSC